MIAQLSIQHYRSIENMDLKLGPINVFVGRNGAGKSNIIDAIRFVRDALSHGLDQAITERHGMSNIRQWSPAKPYDVSINIEAKKSTDLYDLDGHFGFTIASLKEHFIVKKEECKCNFGGIKKPFPGGPSKHEIKYHRDKNTIEWTNGDGICYPDNVVEDDLYIRALTTSFTHLEFICLLKDFGSYIIFPNTLRQPQKQSNDPVLSSHGDNIASIIKRMRMKKKSEAMSEIIDGMKKLVPNLENVTAQAIGGYIVPRFSIKPQGANSHYFDVDQMSDGTLRFLGLLVALYQDPGPSVIALEEPELTVHPGALQLLAEAIREVSYKRQILLTTHSPELLDYFKPEEIIAVEMDSGVTKARLLNLVQMKAVEDDLFSIGQLMSFEGLRG